MDRLGLCLAAWGDEAVRDLERLARAMYIAAPSVWPIEGEPWAWEWLVENKWTIVDTYRKQAHALLTELREPSEGMWRAGADSIDGFQRMERGHAYAIEAQAIFATMIDHILEQEQG